MRKGLVYIWASATMAMVFLYLVWPIAVYIMGVADWVWTAMRSSGINISSTWITLYEDWRPRFRDLIGYMSLVSFISLIIYVIVNSARREPDEAQY